MPNRAVSASWAKGTTAAVGNKGVTRVLKQVACEAIKAVFVLNQPRSSPLTLDVVLVRTLERHADTAKGFIVLLSCHEKISLPQGFQLSRTSRLSAQTVVVSFQQTPCSLTAERYDRCRCTDPHTHDHKSLPPARFTNTVALTYGR